MIVCGSNTKREGLEKIKINEDIVMNRGRWWKPVPHGELVQTMAEEIILRGWKITGEQFALSNDEADLAGAFELEIPSVSAPEGQTFSLGFLTSNAQRRSLKLVVGTRVFVCNNGMATGEIVLQKKHTTGLSLADEIEDGLDRYEENVMRIPEMVARMKDVRLSNRDVSEILVTAGDKRIMPWSRLGKVYDEYQKPRFADHSEKTGWGLLNAFTYVTQKSPPLDQMGMMNRFRELLPIDTN